MPVEVTVQVVAAQDLLAKDYFGLSDPYCVLEVGVGEGVQRSHTRTVPQSLNPEWAHEVHRFVLMRLDGEALRVKLWDHDKLSHDDFLGEAIVPLLGLQSGSIDTWFPLQSRQSHPQDQVTGRVHLRLSAIFTPDTSCLRVRETHTSDADLVAVIVHVAHGRNLMSADYAWGQGGCDPFARVSLMGLTAETKRAEGSQAEGWTWNEPLRFVVEQAELESAVLNVGLWDHDFVTRDDFLGYVHVDLSQLINNQSMEDWYQLRSRAREEDVMGELFIRVHLQPKDAPGAVSANGEAMREATTATHQVGLEGAVPGSPLGSLRLRDAVASPREATPGVLLSLTVLECLRVPVLTHSSVTEPYVKVLVGDSLQLKTRVINDVEGVMRESNHEGALSSPRWLQKMEFRVDDLNAHLVFRLKHWRPWPNHSIVLAECTHTIGSLVSKANVTTETVLTLHPKAENTQSPLLRIAYTLHLASSLLENMQVHPSLLLRAAADAQTKTQGPSGMEDPRVVGEPTAAFKKNFPHRSMSLANGLSLLTPTALARAVKALRSSDNTIGFLRVKIVRAAELAYTSLGRLYEPNAFVELEMSNQSQRTQTQWQDSHPVWNREVFEFRVESMSDVLDITVLHETGVNASSKAMDPPMFLGARRLSVFDIMSRHINGTYCWFPLRSTSLRHDNDQGRVLLHVELSVDLWRAVFALYHRRGREICACDEKTHAHKQTCMDRGFSITQAKRNVNRLVTLIEGMRGALNLYEDLMAWKHPAVSASAYAIYIFVVTTFRSWYIPLGLLFFLLYLRLIRSPETYTDEKDEQIKEDDEDDTAALDDPSLQPRARISAWRTMKARMERYPRRVQNTLGDIVSPVERFKNSINWTHPFHSSVLCVLLALLTLLLLVVPTQHLLVVLGSYLFTDKFLKRKPKGRKTMGVGSFKMAAKPKRGNPIARFLSHISDDEHLIFQSGQLSKTEQAGAETRHSTSRPRRWSLVPRSRADHPVNSQSPSPSQTPRHRPRTRNAGSTPTNVTAV
eukprot:m.395045 g.395045  ORF g.395045 m.395045 type:complete len:1020 (-) comp20099_c0_seq15:149-3208(-)